MSLEEFLRDHQIIKAEFPKLPKGEEWHNPDDLTPLEFEAHEGYRPLLVSEVKLNAATGRFPRMTKLEKFDCSIDCWHKGTWFGDSDLITYRTKDPLPEPAKELTVAEIEKLLGYPVKVVK